MAQCHSEFFLFSSLPEGKKKKTASLQYLLEVSRAVRRKRSGEAIRVHRGRDRGDIPGLHKLTGAAKLVKQAGGPWKPENTAVKERNRSLSPSLSGLLKLSESTDHGESDCPGVELGPT